MQGEPGNEAKIFPPFELQTFLYLVFVVTLLSCELVSSFQLLWINSSSRLYVQKSKNTAHVKYSMSYVRIRPKPVALWTKGPLSAVMASVLNS